MKSSNGLVCVFIGIFLFGRKTEAITCSICGESGLPAPGECVSQIQYDCDQQLTQHQTPDVSRGRSKMLCRTTRSKIGENLFAVTKECISENEHLNKYPEGQAFGCQMVPGNETHPVIYCVCDQNLCNIHSLDEQMLQPQPEIGDLNVDTHQLPLQPSTGQSLPPPQQQHQGQSGQSNSGLPADQQSALRQWLLPAQPGQAPRGNVPLDQQILLQQLSQAALTNQHAPAVDAVPFTSQLIQETDPPSSAQTPATETQRVQNPVITAFTPRVTAQPVFVQLNTETVEFLPESASNGSTTDTGDATDKDFTCMICNEGNLTNGQDCISQRPFSCSNLFRTGNRAFCFTKATVQPTGETNIEKRCASEESLSQELGLPTIQPSCSTSHNGLIQTSFCICDSSKCNQLPLANQMNMHPPVMTPPVSNIDPASNFPKPTTQTKNCYVCGESDQESGNDCSQQTEYDCTQQYQNSDIILCLTRQTKLSNGHYNIEKSCITPSDHQQQYQSSDIILNGCDEVSEGYVQYCICQGDLCNNRNLSAQQQAHNWTPRSAQVTQTADGDQTIGAQQNTMNIIERLRPSGGLLPQPSTPLSIEQTGQSNANSTSQSAETSNATQDNRTNRKHNDSTSPPDPNRPPFVKTHSKFSADLWHGSAAPSVTRETSIYLTIGASLFYAWFNRL